MIWYCIFNECGWSCTQVLYKKWLMHSISIEFFCLVIDWINQGITEKNCIFANSGTFTCWVLTKNVNWCALSFLNEQNKKQTCTSFFCIVYQGMWNAFYGSPVQPISKCVNYSNTVSSYALTANPTKAKAKSDNILSIISCSLYQGAMYLFSSLPFSKINHKPEIEFNTLTVTL